MSDAIEPPEGFVTFVFTDIEDSMKMCAALGNDVYARGMRELHCQRIRDQIARHHGYEVNTKGDSFLIAFQHVDNALACMAAVQQALADPPITRRDDKDKDWTVKVRIGVHTAETQIPPDERNDYIGHDVNLASRVQSLGRGEQVIVSASAYRAAGSKGLYEWQAWPNRRLKSIDTPELVHELLWRGPGTSRGEPGGRWEPDWFKGEPNAYVPREALEDEILAAIAGSDLSRPPLRLVTLHGTGGMGKTRLAIACAIKAAGFFEGRVYFIKLDDAPQPSAEWVVERIALALGLSGPAATAEGVAAYLSDKSCLIVLDNYETVDCDPVAEFIARLLLESRGLRLLVTRRQAIRLGNLERPIRIDGLTPGEARGLFVERAALRKPRGWRPSADELTVIDQIVAELEFVPLSIELAAAWAGADEGHKSDREILAELKKALLGPITAIPPGERRADPEVRHRSMQACLEWSWDRLESQDRDGFASLSLFADSFDAQGVAGARPVGDAFGVSDAEGLLRRLHNAAVLKRFDRAGASRYTMLRTVQEFARQKSEALADRAPRVRAFVDYYVRLASENCNVNDEGQRAVLDREWRNATGAAALAEVAKLWSAVPSIGASLDLFLPIRGELAANEALLHNEMRAATALGDRVLESLVLNRLGIILKTRGDLDGAEATYRKALAILKEMDHLRGMATVYGNLGIVLKSRGDLAGAEAMYRTALESNEKVDRPEGAASNYGNLGVVLEARGDLDGAEAMHRKALKIHNQMGIAEGIACDYGNLCNVLRKRGDLAGAEAMCRKALEIDQKLERPEGMAREHACLGLILEARGDLAGAEAMYRTALEIDQKFELLEGVADQYANLGNLMKARGDRERARELWTKSRELFAKIGAQPTAERVQGLIDGLPD